MLERGNYGGVVEEELMYECLLQKGVEGGTTEELRRVNYVVVKRTLKRRKTNVKEV